MGGSVSTGRDNDELVDNLMEADYIKSPRVENVFRAVDRADYFLPDARGGAYKDQAWKSGNLHMSAPCIYSEVMEGLKLEAGLSFLNLGSGTGYLSTMAGLILGSYGINHGIELQKDCVEYANKKLAEFKKMSQAIDEYDFCEPKFIQGNCLCLTSDMRQYDRVYCGAACPEQHENYMKNLIKVGGILVMPLNEHLLQIVRISELQWDVKSLLPVSFATLILPTDRDRRNYVNMADTEPLMLQAACRAVIRTILRNNMEEEFPGIKKKMRRQPKRPRKKRAVRRFVIPILDGSGDEGSDPRIRERDVLEPAGDTEGLPRGVNTLVDLMLCIDYNQHPAIEIETIRTSEPRLNPRAENPDDQPPATHDEQPASNNAADPTDRVDHINKLPKREKLDSGIWASTPSESDDEVIPMDTTSESDSSNDGERVGKRSSPEVVNSGTNRYKRVTSCRRIVDTDSDSDTSQTRRVTSTRSIILSPYTEHMRNKIMSLPLPPILKNYVNFYRAFD